MASGGCGAGDEHGADLAAAARAGQDPLEANSAVSNAQIVLAPAASRPRRTARAAIAAPRQHREQVAAGAPLPAAVLPPPSELGAHAGVVGVAGLSAKAAPPATARGDRVGGHPITQTIEVSGPYGSQTKISIFSEGTREALVEPPVASRAERR